MDRLRVWSKSASLSEEDLEGNQDVVDEDLSVFRPPPVRTSSTYDDEEAFSRVALNLLSRYQALGISASETIKTVLVKPGDKASFLEGLSVRKSQMSHLSPSTATLVESVDQNFYKELIRMVEEENNRAPPTTPRAMAMSSGAEKKANRRGRFFTFPDSDGSQSGGFFRSRRICNIDWTINETVQQVQTLTLDGPSPCDTRSGEGSYTPPSPVANQVM